MRTGAALAVFAAIGCGAPPPGDPVRVTIPGGASVATVAESLYTNRVIRSPRWFRVYAALRGADRRIRAGVYDLRTELPVRAVLDRLVAGYPAMETLVIPEGMMLTEVAETIETQLGIPADSVLAACRDSALLAAVDHDATTLEGYLFPSTYSVRVGATAREVVRQMVDQFETTWHPAWTGRTDSLSRTRREIVILASIIEGEVRHDEDRRFVSSVYHNRLKAGWRLQADPTVIYALGRRRRLYQRDYLTPSPYNTYQIDGLPPGPIGQPSAASIEAALYPATSDFFYFVARTDGYHVFSRTLREHNRAIARIRGGS